VVNHVEVALKKKNHVEDANDRAHLGRFVGGIILLIRVYVFDYLHVLA